MRPEIDAYVREHGAKYTTEALRSRLVAAGHDPAEVDAALRETEGERETYRAESERVRSRFWRWAVALHAAALVVVGAIVLDYGRESSYFGLYVTGVVVFGIALAIGLALSVLLGRRLLGRGMAVALVVPLISALLLGGTCLGMSGAVTM